MDKVTARNTLLALVSGILLLILWYAYDASTKSGKVLVEIITIPQDSAVSLNDEAVRNGTVYLEPGVYIAEISKEGFATNTEEITITDRDSQKITSALSPISSEAQEWAEQNADQYLDFEGMIGREATDSATDNKDSIRTDLPYHNHLYSIGTKTDESRGEDAFFVTVRAPEIYREAAIQQIKNLGHNPAEYNIKFIDYRNPFYDK